MGFLYFIAKKKMFRRVAMSCVPRTQQCRMYSVSAKVIQSLRYRTEAPMTDCKKALVATEGNMEEAIKWLQKHGAAKAVKKGDRVTDHGPALAAVSTMGKGAAVVQVC